MINFSSVLKKFGPKLYPSPKDIGDQLNIFQDAVAKVLIPLDSAKVLGAQYIKNVTVTTAGVQIPHSLQREWEGFIVTKIESNNVIYSAQSEDDKNFIKLISSSTSTVINLLVY